MFAWQIYLFMTNSCDVKWKTIMGFLGTFPGKFNGDKSFGVKERRCLNLMISFSLSNVFKEKLPSKLSPFDHRVYFIHCCLCVWIAWLSSRYANELEAAR